MSEHREHSREQSGHGGHEREKAHGREGHACERAREHESSRRQASDSFAERDPLAAEEPIVLESSAADPELPAMQEFEVDEGGPAGSKRAHPGLIWGVIAVVAVVLLCLAFAAAGDWFTPTQAEQTAQTEFEEQTVPEDLGANENPEAAEHD